MMMPMKTRMLHILLMLSACLWGRAQETYVFPESVKPLIATQWGQYYPFNLLCPKNKYCEDYERNLAGCGPVAMAQVVNYHRYPSTSPDGEYVYDWGKMFRVLNPELSKTKIVAVAKLISDCGVSSFTSYDDEASSTTLVQMMGAMKRLFNYSDDMCLYARDDFKTPQRDSLFRQLIFSELKAGRPVFYGGTSEKKGSHVFLIDGCKNQKVHVNMGWGGASDGFYDLDDIDDFNVSQSLLIEVADSNYRAPVKNVVLTKAGTLAGQLTDQELLTTRHIQVSGPMSRSDIATLRTMLCSGMLRTVNLERAEIEVLPDSAFYGCTYLSHFVTPRTLRSTGNFAFCKCPSLNKVVFHEGLRVVGNAAFAECTSLLNVFLPTTTEYVGHSAFSASEALLNVELPDGVRYLGHYAFAYCENLNSISLPKALEKAGRDILYKCPNLRQIFIDTDNPNYEVDGLQIRLKH